MRVALTLLVAGLTLSTERIQAQPPLTGTLIDTLSGKPLSGAEIFFVTDPAGQKSGKDGRFSVKRRDGQGTTLIFRKSGYVPIRAVASETGDLGTLYLRPIKGDSDVVAVDAFDMLVYPGLASFYRRKRELTQAYFFTPEEVARGGRTVSDVIRRNRALSGLCLKQATGDLDCGVSAKRGTTYSGFRSGEEAPCAVINYVDGKRTESDLDDLQISDVLAIEAYPLISMTPREFQDGRCGAVVVWLGSNQRE
jgi:hypothetical protein